MSVSNHKQKDTVLRGFEKHVVTIDFTAVSYDYLIDVSNRSKTFIERMVERESKWCWWMIFTCSIHDRARLQFR